MRIDIDIDRLGIHLSMCLIHTFTLMRGCVYTCVRARVRREHMGGGATGGEKKREEGRGEREERERGQHAIERLHTCRAPKHMRAHALSLS